MARSRRIPLPTLPLALAGALATGVLLPAVAPAATACPGADGDPAALGHDATVAALVCLTNHERMAAGLPALRPDARLALAAQRHTEDMLTRGYFSHDAPAPAPFGTRPPDRVEAAGFAWAALGENIAAGQRTPRWVMREWLASRGHCQSIMWTQVTAVGFGIATGPEQEDGPPAPAWVQELTRPAGSAGSDDGDPPCPRAPAVPAPVDGPMPPGEAMPWARPAAPAGAPVAAPVTTTRDAGDRRPLLAVAARRRGRTLRLRVTVPDAAASRGRVRVRIRVRQHGRAGGALDVRRRAGAQRMRLRLRRAAGGAVTIRAARVRQTLRFG
ncbi:CAP domain-containing protein [Patulibacter defluvii]|uniref:CAP domain-containing protein n=1 Tax=Patulibacter defluvii TaxID=3095358 RepID=UPI002A763AFB|nr:CAP domain-containing protein [Patulibacter sp. DM4]